MATRAALLVLLVLACVAGCGGSEPPKPPVPTSAADPELARAEPTSGEILIRGELSPASHGPYELDGRYTVAFEQFAPEDAELDFSQQTSFVAALDVEAEFTGPGTVKLFKVSRRTGSKELELRGRYFVDVSFGDFPYVIRFTPRR